MPDRPVAPALARRSHDGTVTEVRVILDFATGALSIAWLEAPGERSRPIAEELADRLDALAAATSEAERRGDSGLIASSRRALGLALFELLDGPDRALARRLEQAATRGGGLALTVVLRGSEDHLADHPGAAWRWELLSDDHGPLMIRQKLTLAVQLGDVRVLEPRALEHGTLRILFMAYSPRDVEPVLDYEGEEERVLAALSPFVGDGRAQVVVVEFGSLKDLGRELLDREYDVVHLSGHGMLTSEGPRLLMEDEVGNLDRVSPTQLRRVLERARRMPELVMISSCLSAGETDDVPSFTAQLVAGGVPAAIGWVQTVRDDLATEAAADIYQRLCTGSTPAQAVAFARAQLHQADHDGLPGQASHAWGTLHLITRDAAGFFVDDGKPRVGKPLAERAETYRYLDEQGRMRVLDTGFVGRRRHLQRLLRILIDGREGGLRRAGAVIFGNKGTGKSCLAARAIQRAEAGERVVVLHGQLDDTLIFQQLEQQALRWEDDKAEAILRDSSRGTIVERLRRLLASHWSRHRLVFVLDDFEQNLETPTEGLARLSPAAAALLEALLPACRAGAAKLLVTTTAQFELPAGEAKRDPLALILLGGFDPSSLRKLWLRGQAGDSTQTGELAHFTPGDWGRLCERLGRNPRILDWVRTLLRGKTPREVEEIVARAGDTAPNWGAEVLPSTEQQEELVRLFLRHMAYDEAVARISEDARAFIQRARVYELAVPREALEGLCEGLAIDLELHLPALQNLGLFEVGELDGETAQRVSPLVEPEFAAEQPERWHAVAAAYWVQPERHCLKLDRMLMAWEHALVAGREEFAAAISVPISTLLNNAELHRESLSLAQRHLAVFPEVEAGLAWGGFALFRSGDPVAGWRLFEKAEALALARGASETQLRRIFESGARILAALGRMSDATERLVRAVAIEEQHGGEESGALAAALCGLAGVLRAQGDFSGARQCLERSLSIQAKVFGTDEHPDVAAALHLLAGVLQAEGNLSEARQLLERSLAIKAAVFGADENCDVAASHHALGSVLRAQGDLCGARQHFERSLSVWAKVLNTDEHPDVAASLHELAVVLHAQDDLPGARQYLERALFIGAKVWGTDEHPDVAASLHHLALVLQAQGDLPGARQRLERSLSIWVKVFGTEEHPDVATAFHSLAGVVRAEGNLAGARQHLEHSLSIKVKVFGTEEHPAVAASLHELARVLQAQGDLPGARQRLERSLTIKAKVFGTDEHPDVAASLHVLAEVLGAQGDLSDALQLVERALSIWAKVFDTDKHCNVAVALHTLASLLAAEGRIDEAISTLRRKLQIEAKIYKTRDHHSSAESEALLAILLLQTSQTEEALALLDHAIAVLNEQVPGHPLLAQLLKMFGHRWRRLDPGELADLALRTRSGIVLEGLDRAILLQGLEALAAEGSPHHTAAAYLRAVADASVLPSIPDDLPHPIAQFLASVRDAARAIDDAKT